MPNQCGLGVRLRRHVLPEQVPGEVPGDEGRVLEKVPLQGRGRLDEADPQARRRVRDRKKTRADNIGGRKGLWF